MICETEIRSTVEQVWAAREAELSAFNRQRLESWSLRYPHDLVNVPPCIQPPKWPAVLCQKPLASNVMLFPPKQTGK